MANSKHDESTILDLKNRPKGRNSSFRGTFLILQSTRKTARNGNEYLSVELGDRTGQFHFTCFADSPSFAFFSQAAEGTAVVVEGRSDYYQERFSPRIFSAKPVPEQEARDHRLMERLVKASVENQEDLWKELLSYIEGIEHRKLRITVDSVIRENEKLFRTVAAAISMHHAYRCGLLEHTVHLCRAAEVLLPLYSELDRDLVIAGVIVHDIGKTLEYTTDLTTTRTRQGLLQGHVILGYRMVRRAALQARLDPHHLEQLEHIVLSHQGELEWGAAAMASTPEAVFVSMLDNLDAKMGMVQEAIRELPPDAEYSEFLPGLKTKLVIGPGASESPA